MFMIAIKKASLVLEGFLFAGDRTTIRQVLVTNKVDFRERNNRFYIPLSDFTKARTHLRRFEPTQTESYHQFMKRYPEGTPVVIDWHPSYCEVTGGIPIDKFVKAMCYFNEDYRMTQDYKRGRIDGIDHLFHAEKGYFPSGLLERAVEILKIQGIPYTINQQFTFPKPYLTLGTTFAFTPTEDQVDAVAALAAGNSGLGKLPTGFGKTSYVASALIAKKGVRAMFLANQRVLIDDAEADFQSVFAGQPIKIGKIGDGTFDPGDITVASIQGVIAALKPLTMTEERELKARITNAEARIDAEGAIGTVSPEAKTQLTKSKKALEKAKLREARRIETERFLKEDVDMLIIDEAQGLGTAMWKTLLDACPAAYRYGLTATDTRTNGGRLELIAATGERRYESSADEQIAKGRLAEFKAEFVEFDHGLSEEECKSIRMEFHEAYKYFIVENEARNAILIDKMLEWAHEGKSILGLVTLTEHAQRIMLELEARGVDPALYRYVDGSTAKTKRKDTIREFRESKFPILLGTSIFDVGFNAKNASRMIRFNAGSSEVREPQRAGRTVRKRDDDSHGEMFDILDVGCPFFTGQAFKRIKYLRHEFGHNRVKIINKVKNRRYPEAPVNDTPNEEYPDIDLFTLDNSLPF